ncbi:MAG: DUF59 domain-containing protein [Actinobacteria bacterium]|nr:DUF59 domain-containing protein [Actinomycetota bacterium]
MTFTSDSPAVTIPAGVAIVIPAGTEAEVVQTLGGTVTIRTQDGLSRIDAGLAEELGINPAAERSVMLRRSQFSMDQVTEALRTVYDPEIPIDIMELGLVYRCEEHLADDGSRRVEVDLSMTSPGCGMGDVLCADVERVVGAIPGVDAVQATLVWDPPWGFDRLSDAARLQLGLL